MTSVGYLSHLQRALTSFQDPVATPGPTLHDQIKDTVKGFETDVEKLKAVVLEFEALAKQHADGERDIPKIKWVRERGRITALRDSVKRWRSDLSDALTLLQTGQR